MNHRTRVLFETPSGSKIPVPPQAASRTIDGKLYIPIRTHDTGEITRAFATGETA